MVTVNGGYIKGGANYRANNNSNFFFNVGQIMRPPSFDGVFPNADYDFEEADEILNESFTSFELGYGFRTLGTMFEVGHKFGDSINVRIGLSDFNNWDHINTNTAEIPTLNDIVFNQSGSIEFKQLSALIDYHPWQGDFSLYGRNY